MNLRSTIPFSALALLASIACQAEVNSPIDIHIDTSTTMPSAIPAIAMITANVLVLSEGSFTYRWDTNSDGKYDDAEGEFISYIHDFGVFDLTELINRFNNETELPMVSVKVFSDGSEAGVETQQPFNLCKDRSSYYLDRYNHCMATDSRGKNYCRSWMGCYGSIGSFNVENDTGIFYPTYNR